MRIGLISGEYPPMQGGVGAYTSILAQTLVRHGHTVGVLTTPPAAHASNDGVQVDPRMRSWNALTAPAAIGAWVRAFRPDVIDLQFQTAAYRMSALVHFLPDFLRATPFVTTFHDLRHPYLFPKAGKLRDAIVRRLATASDGVIVTNHEDAAQLDGLPCLRLIPIGSNILSARPDPDTIALFRQACGAGRQDVVIAFFGLVNHSKGLDTLLHAVAELRDQGVPIRLALIGAVAGDSDPSNRAYIESIDTLIAQLALAPLIHRTGYLGEAEVAGYLAAADGVALPFADGASYRRGSLMAAIRLGCAIVTTQPRVALPTFEDGVNLLLVPPNDASALQTALSQIAHDQALRARLKAGAAHLAAHFDWDQIADDTVRFFERVIAERSRL